MKPTVFLKKAARKIARLAKSQADFFYFRLFYKKPVFNPPFEFKPFMLQDSLERTGIAFKRIFETRKWAVISRADGICRREFDLLGSGPVPLGQKIPWHVDFKSGYAWDPRTFYASIRYGHAAGVDIKVPWELSRFQHLHLLGQASLLTGKKKYADEFRVQIMDWIQSNRIGFGPHWTCPMEAAIRSVNWLTAREYFGETEFSEEFSRTFYTSLYEHAKFIRSHLERSGGQTHNHYLADLAGLFFIAVYCPFFKESAAWKPFAAEALEREIQKQVYDDGCNFEGSTSYHRLALEIFFYCELLGSRAGVPFSQAYQERLRRMFVFSLYCIKPNGQIPQIGDNDNGRFLAFTERPVLDHRYLLCFAALLYNDSDFKIPGLAFDEEAFWIFGAAGSKRWMQLPNRSQPLLSKAFPDAGWYILRYDSHYCFISCGKNREENNGHTHNDKLSFELMLSGEDIILDPGTYVYTPDPAARNRFRSTGFHNTVQIDAIEQGDINAGLFTVQENAVCRALEFKEDEREILFKGEVRYKHAAVCHRRIFVLDKEQMIFSVVDEVETEREHDFKIHFHLAEGALAAQIQSQEFSFSEIESEYSPSYGKKQPSRRLRAACRHQGVRIYRSQMIHKEAAAVIESQPAGINIS